MTDPRKLWRTYFGAAPSPSIAEVSRHLWNADADEPARDPAAILEQYAVLEQYMVYVEMADRISARRGLTNTFFLTVNTAVFTVAATVWQDAPNGPRWLLVFPLLIMIVQCLAWFWLVRSYRQLNTAKYAVIGALEERLPASPYWRAEWRALGSGEDPARYWPLTHLEQWVPLLFAATYVSGFIAIMAG